MRARTQSVRIMRKPLSTYQVVPSVEAHVDRILAVSRVEPMEKSLLLAIRPSSFLHRESMLANRG